MVRPAAAVATGDRHRGLDVLPCRALPGRRSVGAELPASELSGRPREMRREVSGSEAASTSAFEWICSLYVGDEASLDVYPQPPLYVHVLKTFTRTRTVRLNEAVSGPLVCIFTNST